MNTIKISVRNLVEFILRSGDLTTSSGLKDPDAMQEGARIHKKIQRKMSRFSYKKIHFWYNCCFHIFTHCRITRKNGCGNFFCKFFAQSICLYIILRWKQENRTHKEDYGNSWQTQQNQIFSFQNNFSISVKLVLNKFYHNFK